MRDDHLSNAAMGEYLQTHPLTQWAVHAGQAAEDLT